MSNFGLVKPPFYTIVFDEFLKKVITITWRQEKTLKAQNIKESNHGENSLKERRFIAIASWQSLFYNWYQKQVINTA